MTGVRHRGAGLLLSLLAFLSAGAILALAVIYVWIFDGPKRDSFAVELGKTLLQIFTVAVIGTIIKLLLDDHQRRQREAHENRQRQLREATDARVRAEQKEERLQEFRADKIRRLVGVTNVLRRAPVLIDAHRSAKTYNEQMREIVNAGLELRLIRHETDAIGALTNPAFPDWPKIRDDIRRMEDYVRGVVQDFRDSSKRLSELQRQPEENRKLQPEVWRQISAVDSVRDLLQEVDGQVGETRYASAYLVAHEAALGRMINSSL